MPLTVAIQELPEQLATADAVGLAYPDHLANLAAALRRGLPCLVECSKELVPFLCHNLRCRLQAWEVRCIYVDGRSKSEDRPDPFTRGVVPQMTTMLRDTVRGALEKRVVLLPHLDLMAGAPSGLSMEAREVVALLQENPELVWVGFHDPLLPLPPILEELAPYRLHIGGVALARLGKLITRREARKFGTPLDLGALHRQVAGLNAARLRRFLAAFDREDLPGDSPSALADLRRLVLAGKYIVPEETFEDVPGYDGVKQRLRNEVMFLLDRIAQAPTLTEREELERLLPRGLLLSGLARSAQRLLARALARSIGAVMLEVTGPELKSPYLGGSEENLRQLFRKARQVAPAVILFKDLDALGGSSGDANRAVERSLLRQLQQELDGLAPGELVLVIGTASTCTTLEPGLFHPGRFEVVVEVNRPDEGEQRRLVQFLDRLLNLQLTAPAVERAIGLIEQEAGRDDPVGVDVRIRLLCQALARLRLRAGRSGPTETSDVEQLFGSLGRAQAPHPPMPETEGRKSGGGEACAPSQSRPWWQFWK